MCVLLCFIRTDVQGLQPGLLLPLHWQPGPGRPGGRPGGLGGKAGRPGGGPASSPFGVGPLNTAVCKQLLRTLAMVRTPPWEGGAEAAAGAL